ncbi:MAG: hypothetical protein Q9167_000715 [Letrouitia subvulpina]
MEASGSEASKRPRLGTYDGSHGMQPQPSIAQSHSYTGHTLPPPNPPPPSAHYIPQSPYHDASSHELRSLPEPTPHAYVQAHSGHSTPIREQRPFPADVNYSRRGSASRPTRSPDEYQQYQPTRALSIATSTDRQHYPQQHPIDHAGHSAYAPHDTPMNGNAHHGLPMLSYNDQSHNPSQGHPAEYSQSPVSTMPHSYGNSLLSAQSNYQNMQQKKKGTRAQQPLTHARADRVNQAILDQIAALAKVVNETRQAVNGRLDRMEQVLMSHKSSPQQSFSGVADTQDSKSISRPQPKLESPPNKLSTEPAAVPLARLSSSRVKELETVEASPSGSLVTIGPESVGGSHMPPEVSIQVQHATAAHRLLHWASIHPLVQQSARLKEVSFRPDYVMEKEEKKGVLRVYGRGQGRESTDASYGSPQTISQQGASSPSSSTSTRSDDPSSPASSPPEGLWGTGSIAATNNDPSGSTGLGGSPSENRLDIHPRTLRRLFNSYLENMHILHPFLEKSRLTRMIERFSLRYNKSEQTLTRSLFAGPATNHTLDALRDGSVGIQKTAKRKHSSGHYSGSMDLTSGAAQDGSELRLEHSISTAIILLVMALGKICAWKADLPGPVALPNEKQHDSPNTMPKTSSPTAMQKGSQSPPASLDQSPKPPNFAATNPSIPSLLSGPRTEIQSPRPADDISNLPRNVDVIPGLAYYAKATDILGNLHGLNDLDQVQSHLLAGLFAGQLARTFESWSWIHSACITCRFLVREANMRDIPDSKKDSIKFAFWTCSQLESDILAELDLPRSGIQDIPLGYPKGFMDDFEKVSMPNSAIPHQTIMLYYSGQIHIRNILNDIQHELYPPEDQERATRGTALRNHFNDRLEAWRKLLPPGLQWKDTDPPASNINDARLRAKFYGAKYIVHRPFLRHALDNRLEFSESRSPRLVNLTSLDNRSSSYSPQAGERRGSTRESTSQAKQEMVAEAEILESAKICVAAAIRSTEAFDNIINSQRLIVTNIFGTTHAQFGNMLVLAATYKSNLSFLIPRSRLEHLFNRTINLLRGLRPISDTLYEDAKILEILRRVVFEDTNVSQSFSSDIS